MKDHTKSATTRTSPLKEHKHAPEERTVIRENGAVSVYEQVTNIPGASGMSLEEARVVQAELLAQMSTSSKNDMVNHAATLMTSGRFHESIAAFEQLATRHPEDLWTCENSIGACHFFLGAYEEAIAHYERALEAGGPADMLYDNIVEAREALEAQDQ